MVLIAPTFIDKIYTMRTIQTCNKEYELYWVTGEVVDTGKNMETKVHGSGGGSYGGAYGNTHTAPVRISSTTTIHDQIFLVDREGKEHAYQLQDFNVACRTGNQLMVLWAVRKGKKEGPYIVVHNLSTSKTYFHEKSLKGIFSYPILYPIAAAILCLFLYNLLPYFLLWAIAPFVVWYMIQKREVRKFKTETDFASFN